MGKNIYNLINGTFNLILGVGWIILAYVVLDKKLCDGKEITFLWILPFILVGISFIILSIIIFSLNKRNIKSKKR